MFTLLVQQFKDAQRAAAFGRWCGSRGRERKEAFADTQVERHTAMSTRSDYLAERELKVFCSRLVTRLVMDAGRKFAPAAG
jgi:hypothetical protein